jgi:purine-cytosine permease-like protein
MSTDIDLADVEGAPPARGIPRPEPYDPSRDREVVRARVAYLMIGLLIGIVAAMIGGLLSGYLSPEAAEKVAAVILSPVVGLLGAVLGFYYGEQSRRA